MDDEIRRVYQDGIGMRFKRNTGYLKKLSERMGFPGWVISQRATEIGALPTQRREPRWTQEEVDILQQFAHLSLHAIQVRIKKAGYRRTHQGIRIKRTQMRFLQNLDGHSATAVARCFGVTPKTVQRWISVGWLKATRRESVRPVEQGALYYIEDEWIREFIIDSVSVIDFRKLDKYWLVDLLAN